MTPPRYDVVIIGGGMVGATLGCALGGSRLRVALVDANPPPAWQGDAFDLRVSAITRASQNIFRSLGAWQAMADDRVSPFRDMHVWDAGGSGEIHFNSADIGEPLLGHIIENRVIVRALTQRIGAFDNIDMIHPARLTALTVSESHAVLTLDDDRRIETRLVVGADGTRSGVRELAGIRTRGWEYRQKAVVATVTTELPHRETAWQRFLPTGPLAFLPLASGASSIVWSTSPDHADQLVALNDADFLDALTRAFDQRLGVVSGAGPRAAFGLHLQTATQYVRPRIALIGDAAHTIHPLAGQGVNLGLLDAAALAEVLCDAHRAGKELGAMHVLRRYERWRKGDNLLTMVTMDGFKRLFGTSAPPVVWLRNLGLTVTDRAVPVKNFLARHAMGTHGDLPRLAQQPLR
ncbi:MAG: UbiH/UbiF/VisC/COQ6 family ubiquinone biosynthesis hydroxylase [Gammaproteobacteria bacterium]|nr:MAG: UbiH/UbiF/VisC/COQ6 family ubiquinone biosynthesis hydroxylase [Gammaproteobacteria bacterium]TND04019.1 MAG: UbiH/UbiF/VisC/COQ6 family ubiquinone biosynthesis hydroxylase [Gammaproteobacteria bacterium]